MEMVYNNTQMCYGGEVIWCCKGYRNTNITPTPNALIGGRQGESMLSLFTPNSDPVVLMF